MKDKNIFMEQALCIAFEGMGTTSPNPSVGAVIVRDGEVVSCGGTCAYGCDHAEVTAINKALDCGVNLQGCEMYVTLEPCCHHGKTPPCTDAIIRNGITKVHIPLLDPNPLVSGKGVETLTNSGVAVEILEDYTEAAFDLLRSFRTRILKEKPFVISKSAMTLDGKISTESGDSKWISNEMSRFIVHKLRSRVDAVIVGANTFLNDKPRLDVRLDDFSSEVKDSLGSVNICFSGRGNFYMESLLYNANCSNNSPLRVVIGLEPMFFHADFSYFFKDDNYLIIGSDEQYSLINKNNAVAIDKINSNNLEIVESSDGLISSRSIMDILYKRGVMTVLLEGGGVLNGVVFDDNAIDQFLYFITPKILGAGKSVISGRQRESMSDAVKLKDLSFYNLNNDILYCGYSESIREVL